MPGKKLRIGDLAAELGLNPKTIRYYEQIGLLPAAPRTESGYRVYGPGDVERLRFVLKAKAVGLSLKEIKEILLLQQSGQQPCEHVLALLDRKITAVEQQLLALTSIRQELVALRDQAAQTMGNETCICGLIEHYERH
ncbi:transcriptional regulator, MerR family [Thermobaculum terrenum ATCC BAA-798]|uniref:Transcriptional regulator, MerR family n=1 Tax=Thermobaculum terrenum (strain ATCC BAA-798 / CCMEE 7001 / YNP1) TaxID=525904 RepID=D1CHY6_THET1|nr:heavy metal-responsive transcriptional regulator [Thermobaculum terrenum]ACZ43357.1 transcriptional regulator, MerR family [Thermobaculum terrenum ATCC BAA-798]